MVIIKLKGSPLFLGLSVWTPCVLFIVPLSFKTLMGNFCSGSPTIPSVPVPMEMQAPAPQAAQRTTPAPVQSRHTLDKLPVSSESSPELPRAHSRTLPRPEPVHHGRMSPQDPISRSRKRSASQLESSKSSSPQKTRTRAETLSAPKKSSRSDSRPTNPGENDDLRAMNPR
jgi:hypothetical protein